MFYSGVSWNASGYEVEIVDDEGRESAAPTYFEARDTAEMINRLRDIGQPLVVIVDSTNGILDGRMMAAGLEVYRADARLLPERPVFGSVSAGELALAGQRGLASLVRLEPTRGTQTGREDDLNAGITASATEIAALTAVGRCLKRGDGGRDEVALTFDDGPLQPYTGQILDVLSRYDVPATFFCVGMNVGADPEVIARIRLEGHAFGNHTWSHPFLPELSRRQLVEQIERSSAAIADVSGGPVPVLFRPPYGSRTPEVVNWLAATVPTVVLWDVEPFDWAMPGPQAIARIVCDQAQPGSIVLLHDGGGNRSQTVAALPAIIEGLLERGLRFVLVDDLVTA